MPAQAVLANFAEPDRPLSLLVCVKIQRHTRGVANQSGRSADKVGVLPPRSAIWKNGQQPEFMETSKQHTCVNELRNNTGAPQAVQG